ncbi:Peptidoglycan/xylan/chitin deacetylase, PgdA/CDA1 family [Lachnospiraceae bacterium NE2001]|nr:Peptidoglycan/xylan/chitin deacetylase, PgdA/CDA1 family [Lachnospiraceae bacterium NE2001]
MKKLGKLGKLNIVIIVMAVLFLALPTVITYNLMKKNDELEQKADELVFSEQSKNVAETPVIEPQVKDVAASDSDTADIQLSTETTELEKDTTSINPLTKAETPTDAAKVADSEDIDEVTKSDEETKSDNAKDAEEATETDAVPLNGKKVYLTFDDGPSDYTDELLDILAEYNVKATFFVVRQFDKPDKLRRIAEEGHTIGLHSASHVYSKIYADMDSFENDVQGVHSWVEHLTGIDTRLYRFPGGSSNTVSSGVSISDCVDYLHSHGYEFYDWNAESKDAENLYLTPDQLNANVMYSVRNNEGDSIVLMHDLDDHYNTVEALPALIETLQAEGYELCTLDQEGAPKCQHYISSED